MWQNSVLSTGSGLEGRVSDEPREHSWAGPIPQGPQGSLRPSLVLKEEGGGAMVLLRGNWDTEHRTRVRPAERSCKACEVL